MFCSNSTSTKNMAPNIKAKLNEKKKIMNHLN